MIVKSGIRGMYANDRPIILPILILSAIALSPKGALAQSYAPSSISVGHHQPNTPTNLHIYRPSYPCWPGGICYSTYRPPSSTCRPPSKECELARREAAAKRESEQYDMIVTAALRELGVLPPVGRVKYRLNKAPKHALDNYAPIANPEDGIVNSRGSVKAAKVDYPAWKAKVAKAAEKLRADQAKSSQSSKPPTDKSSATIPS